MTIVRIIVAIVLVVGITFYNSFIWKKNKIENALSDIEVQLKRRHDLIPNLIEIVQWYKKFESDTLTKITEARSQASHSKTLAHKAAAEDKLGGLLGRLFAVAESYPDLKSNQNFLDLQRELSGIEDTIQNARRYYNATVREYNTLCETFPGNQIAGYFKFQKKEFFEASAHEKGDLNIKM